MAAKRSVQKKTVKKAAKPRVDPDKESTEAENRARVLFGLLEESLIKLSEFKPERVAILADAYSLNLRHKFMFKA